MRVATLFLLGAALVVPIGATRANAPPRQGWGEPLIADELRPFDITVFPDGAKLPPGSGTPTQGEAIYRQRCAWCHGPTGVEGPASRLVGADGFFEWSDPLRAIRIVKNPVLALSMGGQWPYATSVFDYVRRAMPHTAPKSLSNDEVYAVSAFLLHRNGLVGRDEVMDAKSLPQVLMPGAARTVSAWPLEGTGRAPSPTSEKAGSR